MNRRRRGGIVCALSSIVPLQVAVVAGAVLGGAALSACASDDTGPASVTRADAYEAVIRWYMDEGLVPATTDATADEPAVIYVAPATGNPIDASAQAEVIAAMSDMSDTVFVVFADNRDDAIDLELADEPVKADGTLLLVGQVDEGPPPVEVSVDVYHDVNTQQSFQMNVVRAGSGGHTVTAVTQVEQN